MDQQEKDRIKQLMTQYLQGADDPEAMQRFDAWYQEFKTDPSLDLSKEDVQQSMQRLHARLQASTRTARVLQLPVKWRWKIGGAAAAVLMMAVLSTAFKPGSVLYNVIHPVEESQVFTAMGESKVITMPDGSRIHLNEHSSLTYTNRYEQGPQRNITLKGEAFFEVTKNIQHPFVVNAGKASITVLGTSFNVSTGVQDAGVVVAVRDGLIALQENNTSNGAKLLLHAGEAGLFKKTGTAPMLYAHANVGNYLSWMDGQLKFEGAPLKEVAAELENIYHVHIRAENATIEKIRLTLQYKHAPLPVVLDVICNSLDLQHTNINGTIVLQATQQ